MADAESRLSRVVDPHRTFVHRSCTRPPQRPRAPRIDARLVRRDLADLSDRLRGSLCDQRGIAFDPAGIRTQRCPARCDVGLAVLGLAALAVPCGIAVDRFSRKYMISLMTVVWSIATWSTGLASSFAALVSARIVVGAGEAGYNPAGYA